MSTEKVVGKLRVLKKTKEQCGRSMWDKNKEGNFHFWNRDQIYPPPAAAKKEKK